MRLVRRSADGAEQNDLGKLTQEPKSPKCINMLVLLNKKKKVTNEGKDLWKINKQKKKDSEPTSCQRQRLPECLCSAGFI